MNFIIDYLVTTKGIDEHTLILLLMLPIVATLVTFIRQVIGYKTFGIYAPIILTFAFYELGVQNDGNSTILNGLKYGISLTAIVLIVAYIAHWFTKQIRLHYMPKMSIVITTVSISILLVLLLGAFFDKYGFISVHILSLLLIITIAEQFISHDIRKGTKKAAETAVNTVVISILSYVLIAWQSFQVFMLKYPETVLIALLLNFLIGKFTGLRIREYLRFSDVINKEELSSQKEPEDVHESEEQQ